MGFIPERLLMMALTVMMECSQMTTHQVAAAGPTAIPELGSWAGQIGAGAGVMLCCVALWPASCQGCVKP